MNTTLDPQTETERLQALRQHAIMDTLAEPVFDDIVRRVAAICETPIALLTLIDEKRQWFKARTGFPLSELPRTIGFDAVTMMNGEPLLVSDVTEDARFSRDPLVVSELNIRFYAGAPITTEEGLPIGALSIMDYTPRTLTPHQVKALAEQAQQAMLQLNLRRKLISLTVAKGIPQSVEIVPSKSQEGVEPRAILPDVMMRFSRDLRYSYVSPFAVEAIGIPPDTLLGRMVGAERVPVPFAGPLKEALQRAVKTRRIEEIEFIYTSPSGERLFQTRLMPEISGGEVKAILAITREVVPDQTPAPEPAPARPALRSLLGIAIAESGSITELLQRCAEAVVAHSGSPLVRIWLRDAEKNELMLRASAGEATDLFSGNPGVTVLEIPADADTLDALAERAFGSEAEEATANELVITDAAPLKTGSILRGIVAMRDRIEQPQEVRDEILESSGAIASALRRSQEAVSLTEQTTALARDLMEARLALQREAASASDLAQEKEKESRARVTLTEELERRTITSAKLEEDLKRESDTTAALTNELERQSETTASLKAALERQSEEAARSVAAASGPSSDDLASLAHELRTPLTSVIGLTNHLLSTPLEPDQRELGELTLSSAEALLQLVNGALDSPETDSALPVVQTLPFDLRHVIEDVAAMLAARAQDKGLDLVVRCSPAIPESLLGDSGRIRQVVTNLVDNAIKFTTEGYVLVDAGVEEDANGEELIAIDVEDTGVGISPEQVDAIFDRYVQVDADSAAGERGAGLGLAISRDLARQLGGSIALRSQVDDGSIFRFNLKLIADPEAPEPPEATDIRGLRVLIADGPYLQQCAERELMAGWGVRVDLCSSVGAMIDAMQDALQEDDPFQAVLLDEQMTGSDSRGVIWTVLNTPAFEHARLVVLTSVARNRDVERMVAEGLSSALTKPVRRRFLLECLKEIAEDLPPRAPHRDTLTSVLAPAPMEPDRLKTGPDVAEPTPAVEESPMIAAANMDESASEAIESRGHSSRSEVADEVDVELENKPEEPDTNDRSDAGQQSAQDSVPQSEKTFALVVEDDVVNQRVSRMMLEKMGCTVDVAKTGKEAAALFETRDYNLVLIDCKLAGMDGYETTAVLRRMEAGERRTPIVAVTADTSPGVRERCLLAGMDAYIAKPVHEEDLKYEIDKLLNSAMPPREVREPDFLDDILDRRALLARVAGNRDVLRSLANLCEAECTALMEEIRESIGSGDRSEFLRAAHKLRGNIMSMEARAAVEAVRRLELTANQGRPIDAEAMLDSLENELDRLLGAMNAILVGAEAPAGKC